jgi:hypothetical protein
MDRGSGRVRPFVPIGTDPFAIHEIRKHAIIDLPAPAGLRHKAASA